MQLRSRAADTATLLVIVVGFSSCAAEPVPITVPGIGSASWSLTVEPDLRLVDTRCTGDGCPRYPNPYACDRLEVTVSRSGGLCASCERRDAGPLRLCGGVVEGLPYSCVLSTLRSPACVVCRDVFDDEVYDACAAAAAPSDEPAPPSRIAPAAGLAPTQPHDDEPRCFDAYRADGAPCQICLRADGLTDTNTCERDRGPYGDGAGAAPAPPDDAEAPSAASPSSVPAPTLSPTECGQAGTDAYVRALEELFVATGIPTGFRPPSVVLPTDEAIPDYACDPSDPWSSFDLDLVEPDGRVNCGRVAATAASHANASATCSCGSAYYFNVGRAMNASWQYMANLLRSRCTWSPIVLDLDGDGVATRVSEARFDLLGDGRPITSAWIRHGDALLGLDRDGDGRITTGIELFGDRTPVAGLPAGDGFRALAALDDDDDGAITEADAAFAHLLLWRDDGDGVSAASELAPLASAAIVGLDLAPTRAGGLDAAGSLLATWSRFVRADGSTGAICDVYFAGIDADRDVSSGSFDTASRR